MASEKDINDIVDSTARNSALYLAKYCNNFEYCADCQFMKDGAGCILNIVSPFVWSEYIDEKGV